MSGPVGILGCPGSGKTTLARRLAGQAIVRTGAPLCVVDTGGVEQFADMRHARGVSEAIDVLWGASAPPSHVAITPASPEEFDRLCAAIYGGRNVILLVDELFNVMPSKRSVPENFSRILREWRRVLAGCFMTSQLYSDAGRTVKGLVSEWYIHRMTAPEDLEDLRRDFGLDPEEIAALPSARELAARGLDVRGAYKDFSVGFAA